MYQRHNEVPVYATRPGSVLANHYSQAVHALRRTPEIRLSLPKIPNMALILQRDAWIVVDESMGDLPVLAWCDFVTQRDNLHQPIACTLRIYHAYARVLLKRVLEAMVLLLGEQDDLPEQGASVLKFRKDESDPGSD